MIWHQPIKDWNFSHIQPGILASHAMPTRDSGRELLYSAVDETRQLVEGAEGWEGSTGADRPIECNGRTTC
jgi:hypothetical protein